jgi:hypothetical protein
MFEPCGLLGVSGTLRVLEGFANSAKPYLGVSAVVYSGTTQKRRHSLTENGAAPICL